MRPGRARAGGGPAERDWRYCLREGSGARKATGHPLEGHPSVDAEKRWAAPELCFRGLGWNRADFSHPDVLASLDECGVGHLLFVEAPPGVQWHRRFPGLGPPRLMEGQATWPQLRAGLEGGEALSAARFAGIKRIVFGAQKENVAGKYFVFPDLTLTEFRDAGEAFEAIGGVLEEDVVALYVDGEE